jgi:myo-inositol-1(or 4)-monophosphatase
LACVNVALRRDGEVATAAVADPFSGEVWWTDGSAAYLLGSADELLAPDGASMLVDVDFDNRPEWVARLVSAAAFTSRFGIRVSSTSLALAWVASGRRAGYVVAGHTPDSVHFAAGYALTRAAGCVVTDLGGRPLGTGSDGLVAAADAATHAVLLEAIAGLETAAD